MRKVIWLCTSLLFAACSYYKDKQADDTAPLGPLSFADMNSKILTPHCAECHGGEWVGNYEATRQLMSVIAARIQSGNPGSMMPPTTRAPLSSAEKAAVLDWVSRGGPLNVGDTSAPVPVIPPGDPNHPNFAFVKALIFDPKCSTCHHHAKNNDFATYAKVQPNLKEMDFRVFSAGPDDQMPPPGKPQLTDDEKKILHLWLQNGAPEN